VTGDGFAASGALPWAQARQLAATAPRPLPGRPTPLAEAAGLVLSDALTALVDLPPFAAAAMDGWAVSGPGPWRLRGQVLAGAQPGAVPALRDGEAVRVATGAPVPGGSTAVLRAEHGEAAGTRLHTVGGQPDVPIGTDIRPLGQECRRGDRLLPPGTVVTPAVLGLAAAAGYDVLPVRERVSVAVLVLGDEIVASGRPASGRIRDAIGPLLLPALRALGCRAELAYLPDDADRLLAAVASDSADVVITTGGTASGPVDHVHRVLRTLDARLLVDGVAVRPGHPMLLARHSADRYVVGLPGNPLAAVAGFVTLAEPLLCGLAGRPVRRPGSVRLLDDLPGDPAATRLVPASRCCHRAVPGAATSCRCWNSDDAERAAPPRGRGAPTKGVRRARSGDQRTR
jgi:molybdopterin molybdotransferase